MGRFGQTRNIGKTLDEYGNLVRTGPSRLL